MRQHLTDDELILHYYGEGRVEDEPIVDAHLQTCSVCQAMWMELRETMKMVDAAGTPEPGADFERVMWARVQQALPEAPEAARPWATLRPAVPWLLGLAAAAAVALAVAWPLWRSAPAPAPVAAARVAADPATHERVLLTALDDQFQRSELLLVEVMNGPATGGAEFGFERQTADDLLGSSRLYRVSAQQNGNVRLAQMLEELESVLVEIARSPERIDHQDVTSLRARIADNDLLFKVRAVSQQIHDRQKSLSTE